MEIINHEADGLQINQRRENGYVNLTQMAKANGKKLNDYLRLDTTKSFLEELSVDTGIPVSKLTQSRKGRPANLQGTWGHPQVSIHCGQWCSPKFAVLVSKWVFQWLTTSKSPVQPPSIEKEVNLEVAAVLAELEKLIISIRSHGRIMHIGSHQPVDELLFKSLHTLNHNQLMAINAAIKQLEMLKRFGSVDITEDVTPVDEPTTVNFLTLNSNAGVASLPPATETQPKPTKSKSVFVNLDEEEG